MFHRCRFTGSLGTAGLRLEVRDKADADGGASGAGHPAVVNSCDHAPLRGAAVGMKTGSSLPRAHEDPVFVSG
jgi:hypothetical protein